jgi:hypothetical protein
MDTITEDGTFTLDLSGMVRNVSSELAQGFVVAVAKIESVLDATPGSMFGRWTDQDGTVYWDLVEVYSDLSLALKTARSRSELAIWDLAAQKEIRC